MRAAIYLRVSTEEQRERQSIATQRDFAERYCGLHEIAIADFYADDGISGTVALEGRQEGIRLLEDARARKFDEVLVYKLDRLGREPRLILNAVKELEDLGVAVRSMTEPFETSTPAGRFLLTILSGVAGLERDNIIQRSTEGIGRLVREGAWVGGVAPYGYRVEGKHREARLVISEAPVQGTNLTEADVIRLIFRMAGEEGKSCFVIAEHLNRLGVPPALARSEAARGKRQRATSGVWRDSRVLYMLTSKTYKGLHIYGKRKRNSRRTTAPVERKVPAIVSDELWDRVQVALKRNRLFCKRNSRRDYLLRGLAKCGHCRWTYVGTVYSGANRPTRKYYVCGSRHKGKRGTPESQTRCTGIALTGDIEDVVWADVERFLREPGPVLEALTERLKDSNGTPAGIESRLDALRSGLAAKEDERARIVGLFRRGRIDEATLEAQLDEIDRERKLQQTEILGLETEVNAAHEAERELQTSAAVLVTLRRRLDQPLTAELKRQLTATLVERIVVETVGEGDERSSVVHVTYRFDAPGGSIEGCRARGIRVLQTLALPLGYAAPRLQGHVMLWPQFLKGGEATIQFE